MRSRIFLSVLLVFAVFFLPNLVNGQMDTFYIQPTQNARLFAVHSTVKSFKATFNTSISDKVEFQNQNLGFGFRFQYKKLGVSISVPLIALSRSDFGKPQTIGFEVNLYPAAFFVQGTFRYIKGFDDLNAFKTQNGKIFRSDNRMVNVGLIGNYIFNSKEHSLRSAFEMINLQKISSGSWMISVPFNYQYFITDSLSLPLADQVNFKIDQYHSFKTGIGGGYSYTKVINNFSGTLLLSGGAEFKHIKFRNLESADFRNQILVNPRARIVGSIIYNTEEFFLGAVGQYLPGYELTDGLSTQIDNWRVRFTVGKRFF